MTSKPVTSHPIRLSSVLAEEFVALHGPLPDGLFPEGPEAPYDDALEHSRLRALYRHIHSQATQRSALCFSGGGIRSATFNLGVIQALAKLNLLDKFDYLSTVSGGGYIGAWLTAWVHRSKKPDGSGIADVQSALNGTLSNGSLLSPSREPRPLTWLRDFSNYLTPTIGLFSADSWTMYGITLRNLLLNWLVLIPLIVASFMIPRLQIAVIRHSPEFLSPSLLMWAGLALAIPSLMYLHLYRPSLKLFRGKDRSASGEASVADASPDFGRQGWFIMFSLVPLVFAAYCLTTSWAWYCNVPGRLSEIRFLGWTTGGTFAATGAGIHLASWGFAVLWTFGVAAIRGKGNDFLRSAGWKALEGVLVAVSGAIGGFVLWAILAQTPPESIPVQFIPLNPASLLVKDYAEWYAAFAVPGFLGLFLLVATLFIGLAGRFTSDQEHEFWGRTGSWMLNAGVTIGVVGAIIIFGPGWMATVGAWTSASIGGVAGILSLVGGFSAKTLLAPSDKKDRASWMAEYGVKVATPLFVILLIVGLALGTSVLVKGWSGLLGAQTEGWTETGLLMPEPYNPPWIHSLALHNANVFHLLGLWGLLWTIGLIMGWCINVNKFSLHGFYRNRLIRAYLGATRSLTEEDVRRPNPLTGFDPKDNISMAELAGYDFDFPKRNSMVVQRPFHIVNIALNLVRSERLAWQQRKAQSFTVSPLHCGSWQDLGYRRSHEYGYSASANRAISLGTAMATSGAAASPNMGYHSSPAVTFLLALFNVRLGWWLGNPGQAGSKPILGRFGKLIKWWPTYKRAHPVFTIAPLVKELFGLTDGRQSYVYLSDGGHFENLGLYEMVLRRCHHIVVVDVGCDPDMSFQDLGNAIRKIRIDQGVDIELDVEMLKQQSASRLSRWHHAIGSIHYDKVDDGAPVGTLLYLKPSLTGDEPVDIQNYAAHHPAFPHEPTSDQFFDESQFESYRHLGEHIATEVLRFGFLNGGSLSNKLSLDDVIDRLEQHWVPIPPGVQDSFLRETQALLDLEKQLRTDSGLARYDVETYPEIISVFGADPGKVDPLDARASLHVCYSQIQLMENIFLGVRLGEHHGHPMNRGWMNLFRRWANADTFRQWWPVLRGTFSRAFVEFAERHLHLPTHTDLTYEQREFPIARIQLLRDQLDREWTLDPSLPERFEAALRNPVQLFISADQKGPAVWLAWMPRVSGATQKTVSFPDGELIGVVTLSGGASLDWQVHGWVKVGYRDVGIGHHLFQQALGDIQHSVNIAKDASVTLVADLGPGDVSSSDEHDRQMEYIRFYERIGFRRTHTDQHRHPRHLLSRIVTRN